MAVARLSSFLWQRLNRLEQIVVLRPYVGLPRDHRDWRHQGDAVMVGSLPSRLTVLYLSSAWVA